MKQQLVEFCTQKRIQSGYIHSIILDVHASWQSAYLLCTIFNLLSWEEMEMSPLHYGKDVSRHTWKLNVGHTLSEWGILTNLLSLMEDIHYSVKTLTKK